MTSQIPKISGDCREIKLQNCSILRYHSYICATHTCFQCNKLLETAFYSLSINLCLSSLCLVLDRTLAQRNARQKAKSKREVTQWQKVISARWQTMNVVYVLVYVLMRHQTTVQEPYMEWIDAFRWRSATPTISVRVYVTCLTATLHWSLVSVSDSDSYSLSS